MSKNRGRTCTIFSNLWGFHWKLCLCTEKDQDMASSRMGSCSSEGGIFMYAKMKVVGRGVVRRSDETRLKTLWEMFRETNE